MDDGKTSLLDELWNGRPQVPRAVSGLLAFSECDAQVRAMIDRGEHEIAMATLGDSCAARRQWSDEYKVPWKEANLVIDVLMYHAFQNETPTAGEEILYQAPTQVLEWTGFVDGECGRVEPKHPGKMTFSSSAEEEDPIPGIDKARKRMEHVLARSYGRGYVAGTARRSVREGAHSQWLADIEDATRMICTGQLSFRQWRDVAVEGGGGDEKIYAAALWRTARRVVARRHNKAASPRARPSVAGVIEAIGQLEQDVQQEMDRRARRRKKDLLEDMRAVAAMAGIGGDSVDREIGEAAAAVFSAVAQAQACAGVAIWPSQPSSLQHVSGTEREVGEHVEAILGIARPSASVWPSACVAAERATSERAAERNVEGALINARHGGWTPTRWDEAYQWYLRHRTALEASSTWLEKSNPALLDRSVAEALIVSDGKDQDLQMAEGWLKTYAMEAASEKGREGIESFAMCVRLLAALRKRARDEARVILEDHGTDSEQQIRASVLAARAHIKRTAKKAERFAERMEWAIGVEAVSAWSRIGTSR